MQSLLLKATCTLACVLGLAAAVAQGYGLPQSGGGQRPAQGEGQDRPHRGPPPEAIAACSGKAAGAACSFTGRQGEKLTGTCFVPPAGGPQGGASVASRPALPMACRPAGMGPERGGPGGAGGPPQR